MELKKLPVLLLHNMVLFPGNEIRLEFDSLEEKQLISIAEGCFNSQLLIANPPLPLEKTSLSSLPDVAVVGQIRMRIDMPNGKTRVSIYGLKRARIPLYMEEDHIIRGEIEEIDVIIPNPKVEIAYTRKMMNLLESYIADIEYSNNILERLVGINSLDAMTDLIAPALPTTYHRQLSYIKETDAIERSQMIMEDIHDDIDILEIEKKIDEKLSHDIDQAQKEYVLREKIRVIKEELGDINDKDTDIEKLRNRTKRLKCPDRIKTRLLLEINRYETSNPNSPEIGVIRNYIDWLLDLPWKVYTTDNKDLRKVKDVLDDSHYGLDIVKERIIEYLAVKQNTKNLKSPIICLVGPPGVGKTSLAKSIAESLNRRSTKISVGGINDEAEIVGHRRTYVGAAPGLIIQGMKKSGSSNPVFIIDEIDKMTKDIKGDPASALLEILDPEQNRTFSDHYIEEEFDLSKVMFITTANYFEQISPELRDRLEIIELSSYTEYEKLDIAKSYLLPKEIKEHGLKSTDVKFSDEVILTIIRNYTKEAGVRDLERNLASILRKIVKQKLLEKKAEEYQITDYNIEKYLGKKKYLLNENDIIERIGVVNGLAYTPFGGDILPIEAVMFPGSGKIIMTGQLGDVMKESAQLSFDYLKSNYEEFHIDYEAFEKNDIHIHVPEGAIPKDGPSAGVTLTTTLLSLLTNHAIATNIAMTGEMTLRGKVLPIGGLKEKVIGAHRNLVKTIFIPRNNEKDLEEIPEEVKQEIEFVLVDRYLDIHKSLFKKKRGRKNDPRNIRLLLD